MVISIFVIYMYHHRHYCYCYSRLFYPNRAVFTYLITIKFFYGGFLLRIARVKGVAHLKRLERFILNSVIKNFIRTIRYLSYSRSEFSNVLD